MTERGDDQPEEMEQQYTARNNDEVSERVCDSIRGPGAEEAKNRRGHRQMGLAYDTTTEQQRRRHGE